MVVSWNAGILQKPAWKYQWLAIRFKDTTITKTGERGHVSMVEICPNTHNI